MTVVAIDVGTALECLRPGNRGLTLFNLWVNLCACGS